MQITAWSMMVDKTSTDFDCLLHPLHFHIRDLRTTQFLEPHLVTVSGMLGVIRQPHLLPKRTQAVFWQNILLV